MTTSNIFEVVIGQGQREAFRWDALWRTWHWLCSPGDGHGIGASFVNQLATYAGIPPSPASATKVEFQIQSELGNQWVDLAVGFPSLEAPMSVICFEDVGAMRLNDKRKMTNLRAYLDWGRQRATDGRRYRLFVVTNSVDPMVEKAMSSYLGPTISETTEQAAWKLLPIARTGEWVAKALNGQSVPNPILTEYVSWAAKFGPPAAY